MANLRVTLISLRFRLSTSTINCLGLFLNKTTISKKIQAIHRIMAHQLNQCQFQLLSKVSKIFTITVLSKSRYRRNENKKIKHRMKNKNQ